MSIIIKLAGRPKFNYLKQRERKNIIQRINTLGALLSFTTIFTIDE